jgi:hypothetical protein
MQILKAGVLYFVVVFGAGFMLGRIRILCVAPRLGARMAELTEAPIIFVVFVVAIVAARWIVRRLALPTDTVKSARHGWHRAWPDANRGVLWLQGLSIREYLAGRDAVAGTVYYVMLAAFAMPLLVARR